MASHARHDHHAEQFGLSVIAVADLTVERHGKTGAFTCLRTDAERLLRFGRALPTIRAAVEGDLKAAKMGKRQVLATAVRLIDAKKVRAGHEQDARNGTRGASTLTPSNLQSERMAMLRSARRASPARPLPLACRMPFSGASW